MAQYIFENTDIIISIQVCITL